MRTNARVYVLARGENLVKVGHSVNVEARMRALGIPVNELELVHLTDEVVNAERVERLAHKFLQAYRIGGATSEWFSTSAQEAVAAIEAAVAELDGKVFNNLTNRLSLRVDQETMDILDRLRARQTPYMNRSNMVRKLVLEAARKVK